MNGLAILAEACRNARWRVYGGKLGTEITQRALRDALVMSDEAIAARILVLESASYGIGTEQGRDLAISAWVEWSVLKEIQIAREAIDRARTDRV